MLRGPDDPATAPSSSGTAPSPAAGSAATTPANGPDHPLIAVTASVVTASGLVAPTGDEGTAGAAGVASSGNELASERGSRDTACTPAIQ